MEREQWRQVGDLYHGAQGLAPLERAAFIERACAGDEALKREIEWLLSHEHSAEQFLERPPPLKPVSATTTRRPPNNLPAALWTADVASVPVTVSGGRSVAPLPVWALTIVGIATLRTFLALSLYLSSDHTRSVAGLLVFPIWVYAVLCGTLTLLGLSLVFGTLRDSRAAWLGGVFTLTVAPFATPLIQVVSAEQAKWLINVRPDAFAAAFLWSFLARFPSDLHRSAGRVVHAVAAAAALVGLALAAANLAAVVAPESVGHSWWTPWLATRQGRLYWLIVLGMTAPALLVLLLRARAAHGTDRRRAALFIRGFVVCVAPIAIEVLLWSIWPAYAAFAHSPDNERWVAVIIFGPLATLPFLTAYSVLFDRVVAVRVVLRAAIQYVMARYTIVGLTLVPFAALAVFLFQHRSEPIVSLMAGPRPLLLTAFIALALVTLRLRSQWLTAVDRRYFREVYDAHGILSRFVGEFRPRTAEELSEEIRVEINGALHADVQIFLCDDARTALLDVAHRLPSLPLTTTLARLAVGDSRPMDVQMKDPASPLRRLPVDEQQWLREGSFTLVVAIHSAGQQLEGLIALGEKRSGLPYSKGDRGLVAAVASAAGLALDSIRLSATPEGRNEPAARECLACARISAADATRCRCGGTLTTAAGPHVLRGVFRLEQRIGAGGMGIVYRALDLNLHRDVAIKALPRATPEHVARLRREARAMAAVNHANLAVIYAVETWHNVPFLVQEYIAGGTLAARLAESPLTVTEALDFGITIAELLDYLHRQGVVHCDIKPSNIGFSQDGTVKLLDFGLARVLVDATVPVQTHATTRAVTASVLAPSVTGGWFGTPQFMSPEAVRQERPGPMFDLWALAVVLYAAISGRQPFDGAGQLEIFARIVSGPTPDLRQVAEYVPVDVAAFLMIALAKDPASRPPDAASFARSLRRIRSVVV